MNDFLIETAAGVAAALIMLFVQARWIRTPSPQDTGKGSGASISSSTGNQVIISGDGNSIQQQYQINSQRTTVHNHGSEDTGSGDDWLPLVLGAVAAVFAAAGIFLIARQFVCAITLGFAAAVAARVLLAFRRARHAGLGLTAKAAAVLACGMLAAVSAAVNWILIGTVQRDGQSLADIAAEIPPMTPKQSRQGPRGWIDHFMNQVLPTIGGPDDHLPLVLSLLLGAVFSVLLLVLTWRIIVDFETYLSVAVGIPTPAHVTARASRFEEITTGAVVITTIILLGISTGASAGFLHDIMTNTQRIR